MPSFADIDMQHCPNCGAGELKIIAAILERPLIEKFLAHLGLQAQPPPKGRAGDPGAIVLPERRPPSGTQQHGCMLYRSRLGPARSIGAKLPASGSNLSPRL
jgi:hypothetical protein